MTDPTVLADMARTHIGRNGRRRCRGGLRGYHGPMVDRGGHVYECMGCSTTADMSGYVEEMRQSGAGRTPGGGVVIAVQAGRPIREFGAVVSRTRRPRRRIIPWLFVLAALIAAGAMGARAWDAAPVDSTGCPATASVQECPR